MSLDISKPQRGCGYFRARVDHYWSFGFAHMSSNGRWDTTPLGLISRSYPRPKVGAVRQPWAPFQNAVGVPFSSIKGPTASAGRLLPEAIATPECIGVVPQPRAGRQFLEVGSGAPGRDNQSTPRHDSSSRSPVGPGGPFSSRSCPGRNESRPVFCGRRPAPSHGCRQRR